MVEDCSGGGGKTGVQTATICSVATALLVAETNRWCFSLASDPSMCR